jgi:hypothetical protein
MCLASKFAYLLACSLLCFSWPLTPNLPASPYFATKNEYSTQPHSGAAAQFVKPAHHNKSKMRSPLAKSSISNEILNSPQPKVAKSGCKHSDDHISIVPKPNANLL